MIGGNRVIAVEEHFATDSFQDRINQLEVWDGDQVETALMAGMTSTEPLHDRLVDFDTRLAEMGASGVDMSVLSLNPPGAQPYVGDDATALAHDFNDVLAGIVASRPDRFGGLGSIAPQNPHDAAAEIERIMGPLGLNGVMIDSHVHGMYLDEPQFEPVLSAAEQTGAAIYLHPRVPSPGMRKPFENYGMLGALWGYQAEAGTHAARLIFSGTLDRHPNLRLVLGHLGEGLPYWLTRMDSRYRFTYDIAGEQLGMAKLEATPTEYMLRNFLVTTSGMTDHRVLALCLQVLGPDRVMFAVDYPYEQTSDAADALASANLDDEVRAKISHRTAERVFGIKKDAGADTE